ncbi:MAG: three-Cys-motif partner protein TcmP [Acidobacteria bacterium]|nr:three-Cys-motif partner protein TcmP [Acidobacteriota bacterium]
MDKLPGVTEIGAWSQIKLQIVRDYAQAYSIILAKQPLKHDYIDAFAGAGFHSDRHTKGVVAGSPLNALYVDPPFNELYLIDLDGKKIEILKELTRNRKNVHIEHGDCNQILLNSVFPKVRYEDYRRALCLLDPYGLHLNWKVIEVAATMKSVEIFLNFPTMDMNRNVLLKKAELASPEESARLTAFWGDESWKDVAYTESAQQSFFEDLTLEKTSNDAVAAGFRNRLQKVAGFKYVPEPIKLRNKIGATIYYLFFASNNRTGNKIAEHIFKQYR